MLIAARSWSVTQTGRRYMYVCTYINVTIVPLLYKVKISDDVTTKYFMCNL